MDTHEVTYRGERKTCTEANFAVVCEGLIAEKGAPGANEWPIIKPLVDTKPKSNPPTGPGTYAAVKPGEVDAVGKLRAESQEDLARDAGFAPKPPVYSTGTRVVKLGETNARKMQMDHDAKPPAKDVAEALVAAVRAEDRHDLKPEVVSQLRMDNEGRIVLPSLQETREIAKGPRYAMSETAFSSLFSRLPCRSATGYLSDCPTRLRAVNFNHWATELGEREKSGKPEDRTEVVLRTRRDEKGRHAFAAVTSTYTSFDGDKIGQALALAFPADARGSLDYDGQRMRIEGLWRTDVAPGEFVAGEFFKAGVIIRASDTGDGSIRVQSVLWRNLCLNLIILDKSIGVDIRIRHVGDVRALATKFNEAFNKALGSIEPFRKAWGYAMAESGAKLVERAQGTTSDTITNLPVEAVLPGLFNGIIQRELVPVKGMRKPDMVKKLVELHNQDEARDAYGVSRASIVNAFTRYAHVIEQDPFQADAIREGAGALLGAKAPPLPYVAMLA